MKTTRLLLSVLCLSTSLNVLAQENQPIAGIGPAGPIEKVQGGFTFTEGPAADAGGNVYFTDVHEFTSVFAKSA